jgi:anti-sigma B factor antagonist
MVEMKIDEQSDTAIISLRGKLLGGPFAEEMNSTLRKLIQKGKKNIILELEGVTILNSSGFGILISSYTSVKNRGGDLRFAKISPSINALLSMTKLNKVFKYYSSVEEALKSFEKNLAPEQK